MQKESNRLNKELRDHQREIQVKESRIRDAMDELKRAENEFEELRKSVASCGDFKREISSLHLQLEVRFMFLTSRPLPQALIR